jgi:hypothetical protein
MRIVLRVLLALALVIPAGSLFALGDPPPPPPDGCAKCAPGPNPPYFCNGGYTKGIQECPPLGCEGSGCDLT